MNRPMAVSIVGFTCMFWGVGGVMALLTRAIWRLTPIAVEPLNDGSMTVLHWALLFVWSGFMAYSEGFRGFQKAFSPRVVSRAVHLGHNPTLPRVVFAPMVCMGLWYATRKRMMVSWCLLFGIVVAIIAVQSIEQPWRGIIDCGVVVGLGWGLISLFAYSFKALAGRIPTADPEVPNARV